VSVKNFDPANESEEENFRDREQFEESLKSSDFEKPVVPPNGIVCEKSLLGEKRSVGHATSQKLQFTFTFTRSSHSADAFETSTLIA
jgi:hypothetical protein